MIAEDRRAQGTDDHTKLAALVAATVLKMY